MIHLDTTRLIHASRPGTPDHAELRRWLESEGQVGISSIALAEFLCGPLSPQEAELVGYAFPAPEPFLAEDAPRAAELFNIGGRRRRGLNDCMIAAVAIRCDAQLATENVADFRKFEAAGLQLLPPRR